MFHSLKFLNVNLQPSIAVVANDLAIRRRQLRTYRRTKRIAHRRISASGEKVLIFDFESLMQPADGCPCVSSHNGVPGHDLAEATHDIVWRNGVKALCGRTGFPPL